MGGNDSKHFDARPACVHQCAGRPEQIHAPGTLVFMVVRDVVGTLWSWKPCTGPVEARGRSRFPNGPFEIESVRC